MRLMLHGLNTGDVLQALPVWLFAHDTWLQNRL